MKEIYKKIYLDNLPYKMYKNGVKHIIWSETAGYKVNFEYGDIRGELEIVSTEMNIKNKNIYVTILYNNKYFKIYHSNLVKCAIGKIVDKYNREFRFQINENIETKTGKIKIIKTMKIKNKYTSVKAYQYECLVDGHIGTILESNLLNGQGCPVCYGRVVLIGINDMWTTNPELAKLLENPEDGYRYTQNSNKTVDWKCASCGNIIKNKQIAKINSRGLSCPRCSDGISYPEKLMYNLLRELNIDFIYQLTKKTFKWCGKYKYDFYLKKYNIIIEVDGGFHSIKSHANSKITLEETKEIDKIKDNLAYLNGIELIRIDCKNSELEYIKTSIFNSRLSQILILSSVNWNEVEIQSRNSLIIEACKMWNNGTRSTQLISNNLGLSLGTIINYLKIGVKINICDYDPILSQKENGKRTSKLCDKSEKVICLNNKKVYKSISNAESIYNISHISLCCNGKTYYAGKLNGEKLVWMFYKEYKTLSQNEIDKRIRKPNNKLRPCKMVMCIETGVVFNSIVEAARTYGVIDSEISKCCKNKCKHAGRLDNGTMLSWKYYDTKKV